MWVSLVLYCFLFAVVVVVNFFLLVFLCLGGCGSFLLRYVIVFFFFSSRRRHTRWPRDWSSDVCSSDLQPRQDRVDPYGEQARRTPCGSTRSWRGWLLAQSYAPWIVSRPRGLLSHPVLLCRSIPGLLGGETISARASRGRLLFLGGGWCLSRVPEPDLSVRRGAVV